MSYYGASRNSKGKAGIINSTLYTLSGILVVLGTAYLSVPAYSALCNATGLGGTPKAPHPSSNSGTNDTKDDPVLNPEKMKTLKGIDRKIKIFFNADKSSKLPWKFIPLQPVLTVKPGESALAFFQATNSSPTESIVGISTYNIVPEKTASYFNKIQCFCFEEQILHPKEQVDMPVFFYIDPDFATDPEMADVDQIILSYTFYKSKDT